jgi:hypothetical protein
LGARSTELTTRAVKSPDEVSRGRMTLAVGPVEHERNRHVRDMMTRMFFIEFN